MQQHMDDNLGPWRSLRALNLANDSARREHSSCQRGSKKMSECHKLVDLKGDMCGITRTNCVVRQVRLGNCLILDMFLDYATANQE